MRDIDRTRTGRKRFIVYGLLFTMTLINYFDLFAVGLYLVLRAMPGAGRLDAGSMGHAEDRRAMHRILVRGHGPDGCGNQLLLRVPDPAVARYW